jgi:hypothetical protein
VTVEGVTLTTWTLTLTTFTIGGVSIDITNPHTSSLDIYNDINDAVTSAFDAGAACFAACIVQILCCACIVSKMARVATSVGIGTRALVTTGCAAALAIPATAACSVGLLLKNATDASNAVDEDVNISSITVSTLDVGCWLMLVACVIGVCGMISSINFLQAAQQIMELEAPTPPLKLSASKQQHVPAMVEMGVHPTTPSHVMVSVNPYSTTPPAPRSMQASVPQYYGNDPGQVSGPLLSREPLPVAMDPILSLPTGEQLAIFTMRLQAAHAQNGTQMRVLPAGLSPDEELALRRRELTVIANAVNVSPVLSGPVATAAGNPLRVAAQGADNWK